jgi:N-acylneuraminate cytidylyltransferase
MIIAFIPARSGSKSIPDKNIKTLGDKPLLAWTIETALKSGLQRVIVSSDSEEYLKIAKEYGAETMLRPQELAQDNTPMYQVLKSEIPKIEPQPEIVVLLSPTVPFRKTILLKSAISFFGQNLDKYDSLMTVQRVPDQFNPAQVIVSTPIGLRMANGALISNRITSRQEYPLAYVTSQGIYIFKPGNLAKGSFYGEKTMLMECDASIDINSPEDWEKCEEYLIKAKNDGK